MPRTIHPSLAALILVALAVPALYGGVAPVKPAPGLELRLIAQKDTHFFDRGGRIEAEYRRMLEEGNKKNEFVTAAAVDLVLEFRNTSDRPRAIYLDGDFFNLGWRLEGPGAFITVHMPEITTDIKMGKAIWIEPGKNHALKVGALQGGSRGIVTGACWTAPGEYTLQAAYRLEGAILADKHDLVSNSVKLKVVAADDTAKATDYLTRDGLLKDPIVVRELQGGVAGYSGTYHMINVDGRWGTGALVVRGGMDEKIAFTPIGKLTPAQLKHLAEVCAQQDLAGLKDHGEVEVNPRKLTILSGKKSTTLLSGKGKGSAEEDRTVRARYEAIAETVKALCLQPTAGPLQLRLVARKEFYALDLGGKTPQEFRKLLEKIKADAPKLEPKLPAGPRVDLVLEIVNTGDKTVTLWQNANDPGLRWRLLGPGVVVLSGGVSPQIPEEDLAWRSFTIAPGKSHSMTVKELDSQEQVWQRSYWTKPGVYLLSAQLTLFTRKPAASEVKGFGKAIDLTSPTIELVVLPAKDAPTKPAIKKASADRIRGMKAAVADVEAGKLRWKEPPLPYPAWHPRFVDLLLSECGVHYQVVDDARPDEMEGYNDVMRGEIEHRFGRNVLDRLHKKAYDEHFNKDGPKREPISDGKKPVKGEEKSSKEPIHRLWLESGLLPARLPMPESSAGVAAFSLQGTLTHKGEGKGKLAFDVKSRLFNEVGEVAGTSDTADVQLDCTFKYIKSMTIKEGPPLFGSVEWRLHEIKGEKLASRLSLALPAEEAQTGRLLIQDRAGKVVHVVDVRFPAEKLAPCHPGCFPAGTAVTVPHGTRPIESLGAGDLVTIVHPDGTSAPGVVQSVFVTHNRLLQVETEAGTLLTSATQPLCLTDGTMRPAEQLQAGDTILRWKDGKRLAVRVERSGVTERTTKVFNLVLGSCEVFIANGFLVRSKPPGAGGSSAAGSDSSAGRSATRK